MAALQYGLTAKLYVQKYVLPTKLGKLVWTTGVVPIGRLNLIVVAPKCLQTLKTELLVAIFGREYFLEEEIHAIQRVSALCRFQLQAWI